MDLKFVKCRLKKIDKKPLPVAGAFMFVIYKSTDD